MASGVREAKARISADTRRLDSALGRSRKGIQKWAAGVRKDISGALRRGFDTLGSIAGFGGIAGLAIVGREVLQFEERLTRLGIQAGRSSTDMARLKESLMAVSTATGTPAEQLLAGAEKFVGLTGDFEQAAASVGVFGKVAAASGAQVEEIASTAAALNTNMGLTAGQMEDAFDILISQGKAGAVELKDMASLAASLTPQFSQFGTKGIDSLAEMGAALQIVRSGFGTSEEAATGLEALMGAIVKQSKRLRGAGVRVFETGPDGQRRMREFSDVVFDLLDKTKGDPEKLATLLGRKEAYSAILQFMRAGRGEVERLIELGKESNAVQEDSSTFLNSTAGRIAKAKAGLEASFNQTIAKHADSIAKAFEKIAEFVDFIVKNPVKSALMFGGLKFGPGLLGEMAGGLGGAMGGGGRLGKIGGALKGIGNATVAGAVGYGVGTVINETLVDPLTDTSATKINRRIAEEHTGKSPEVVKLLQRAEQLRAGGDARDEAIIRQLEAKAASLAAPAAAAKQQVDVNVKVGVKDGNLTTEIENDRNKRRGNG